MSSIAGLPSAHPEEIGLSSAALNNLTQVFQRDIDRGLFPGVIIAVARHGRLGYLKSLGKRDPATGAAMTDDTIFRIYSMTKPIVSVAAMMLLEEGRFAVADPIAKFIPGFANPKIAVLKDGAIDLVPARRDITVQDILRHTSGLTYGFTGTSPVHKLYEEVYLGARQRTAAEHAAALAKLPLMHQPGTRWEYSQSTDVLGHLVELWSGRSLGAFLEERIFTPLGMVDTAFHVPAAKHARLAESFAKDPETGAPIMLLPVREPPKFEGGGGGLVSTIADYSRFCQMLLGGGSFDGARLLGRKTVEWMTADHLLDIDNRHFLLGGNLGFGLGFAVARAVGGGNAPGSRGFYSWAGAAGTFFLVDPSEHLFAVFMVQLPQHGPYIFPRVLATVNAALLD
jgi:CubicO group peptidase (beta-lactamase class C family)